MSWKYERGSDRHKHRWSKPEAGFEPGRKGPIGKCPCDITDELAESILNRGIPFHQGTEDIAPTRIYAYFRGAIYEAVHTTPGVSYHGYPWRGDLPGRPPIPRRILRQLEQQAEAAGEQREYKQWLKKYSR